ncbi:energy-coupling factor transporter ATPase [Desulforamulus aeronauticus]|uniref:Energy-coupling factor transporter ATP-binding protein EcfA2 n=1 Tax=Desulforamulus aeronauticus DSM 10349 TaxID=1121421 RepID=A0A1M6QIJ8_9FIRM|nr:energy-coupling factor transporter ATPase [Desulforamulus aeronauticus]SHK19985.1 energy-coupling factor transport system ATP-binding protein [Desulforamulus aeronauticus DSM 10349]
MSKVIEIENLQLTYAPKTSLQRQALQNINLTVESGEFRAIIGPQGSGKSTLLQVMAGLELGLGKVVVDGLDLSQKKNRRILWQRVGVIFQQPERQLFEDSLYNDVAYGPKNMALTSEEIERRVKAALKKVKLGEEYYPLSPFKLSGGQQRRAAIAGILAMEPKILLLDEPTAGLDPRGRQEIMNLFTELCRKQGITTILVSHDMEEVAHRADKVTVLHKGKVFMEGCPQEIFARGNQLAEIGLAVPFASELANALRERGKSIANLTTLVDAEREVGRLLGGRSGRQQ